MKECRIVSVLGWVEEGYGWMGVHMIFTTWGNC